MGVAKRVCKYGHDTAVTGRYPGGNCAVCSRATVRKWHADNPGRVVATRRLRIYGITSDQYDDMLAAQGGVCLGCGDPPARTSLCVDHDHNTGRIRGLLCHKCNRAMGLVGDSAEALRRLADYLERAA